MDNFEWPPELEESIYDLVRPHVRSKLKRRTWDALHKEMLAKVPTCYDGATGTLVSFSIRPNTLPEAEPRLHPALQVLHVQPPYEMPDTFIGTNEWCDLAGEALHAWLYAPDAPSSSPLS